ncbi:uncharacterized protein J7T54_000487 [Emericellopsis cladophorae]|uniref:CFEM domain-containing protein n=1 Tax=Emericellopsis cladophorae TaxID=2686198 RepID=A0A9Q0BBS6_9HYPO|nr:uncharacterized protein J7T54_000487 [Emericellopsis cladophorae]KAI6778369.1 hypothetical protein J7T54_000487 [Emericellopsis cladophorae]
MLFSNTVVRAMLALAGFASAQSLSEEQLAGIKKAQDAYPDCAKECMAELVPKSDCEADDILCLCTNEALTEELTKCALAGCTLFEGLEMKNITMHSVCGAPVRDKHLQPLLIGLIGGGLAGLAYVMRLCSTFSKSGGRTLGMDDHMCSIAVLMSIPPTVFAYTLVKNGLGRDMWTLTADKVENVLMFYYLGSIFYFATITFVKLSLLAFILRVFPDKSFRKVVWVVTGLVMGYGISFIVATALQCSPAEGAWKQLRPEWAGTCNNIHLQKWMSAIFNIVLDLVLLALPLRNLWNLHMEVKKKVMIMFMFSLGIFVTIISVIRLHSLVLFANTQNVTWDYVDAAYWSTIEIHVSIIMCCLPSCRHLLVSLGATILKSKSFSRYGSQGYGSKSNPLNSNKGLEQGGVKVAHSVSVQQTPKHGDEHDFVPLKDYPHSKAFEKTYTVTASKSDSKNSL